MSLLTDLVRAIDNGSVEVVDLTAPLSSKTPILKLPEPFGQTWRVRADGDQPLRRARARPGTGTTSRTGEHTGTHFDAPIHWITGRDGDDVSQVPAAPADRARRRCSTSRPGARPTRTSCSRSTHVEAWEAEHGPLPEGGWLLYRTGWDARADDQAAFLNANETGPHTPGISVECAKWLAEETPIHRARRGDRRHRRRRGALVRPAVPVPLVPARRRQVRPDPAAEPRRAAAHRRGGDRRPAADRRRLRQPGPGAGAGRALMAD